jgi:hypothetical protein
MRRRNKNILPVIIAVVVVIAVGTVVYINSQNKHRDIKYSVERYLTTGIFNRYKLYKLDKMDVSFSDGSLAVMSVSGLQDKAPHKSVNYKIFMEKSDSGVWKVKKVYPE